MEKKPKEFREKMKLDDNFFMEANNRNLEVKSELAKKMEEERLIRQSRADEQWKILSEFGPIR